MSRADDGGGYLIPPRYWAWAGTRRGVGILLWAAALAAAAYTLWHAWTWFDPPPDAPPERRRADGNGGHVEIDFGGQWVMGRMVVLGHADELYHRQRQWQVVRAGFPVEDEMPVTRRESLLPGPFRDIALPSEDLGHDADRLMSWFMGRDPHEWKFVGGAAVAPLGADPFGNPFLTAAQFAAAAEAVTPEVVAIVEKPAVGGPLYPPVHAFLYAPLGLIGRPQTAYRVMQVVGILCVFLAGLGVKVLTRGRIPWSAATLVLFLFPGTRGGLDLGQNPTVSLAIVVWGWALASRGYGVAGGMVWGLFAFKPIWGLAFFLVPVLTRRWRFAAAMVLTGAGLGAATLPFVGLHGWFDWLEVGKEAAALYNVNNNWIHLSRDLQGVPRRVLHNFTLPEQERDTVLAASLAWGLWGVVLLTTVWVYLRHADRTRTTGVGAAFLFFGAYLTCYRFMYYDVLLAAVGCVLLLADPVRFLRGRVFAITPAGPAAAPLGRGPLPPPHGTTPWGPRTFGYVCSFPLTVLALLLAHEAWFSGLDVRATFEFGYWAHVVTAADGATRKATPKVEFSTGVRYPWETALVFAMWVWCGWALARGEERPTPEKFGGEPQGADDRPGTGSSQ